VAEKESLEEAKLKLTKEEKDLWHKLCRLVDNDSYSIPFKVVMAKLCKNDFTPGINISGEMEAIVEGLFSIHPQKEEANWSAEENPALVMETEMKRSTSTLKTNMAPSGSDGELNKILKNIDELRPGQVLHIFKNCITQASPLNRRRLV